VSAAPAVVAVRSPTQLPATQAGAAAAFARAKAAGRAALIGYLPAGFPSMAGAIAAIEAMVAAGVDIVEIGLPYSDPVMDGPTIQRATERALARGVRTRDVLATVEAVAATPYLSTGFQ
jgi:tryptophan synthase alpha chain